MIVTAAQSASNPRERIDPRRHKLVVVTTSGGAYRAAFWTALVLDELVRSSGRGHALEGFADQIRLLTGASGGMVASAYFAALASPDGWSRADPPSIRQRLVADIRNARDRDSRSAGRFKTGFPIDRDSLGPVAQQTLQRDAVRAMLLSRSARSCPGAGCTGASWGDRGLALEEQWATLDLTFRELEQGVAEGWRPWLILSPMIADTGQPMLISNVPVDPVLERVEGTAIDLFDLFPGQRGQLKVSTAVRMNASFPYISPAVSLPTCPSGGSSMPATTTITASTPRLPGCRRTACCNICATTSRAWWWCRSAPIRPARASSSRTATSGPTSRWRPSG